MRKLNLSGLLVLLLSLIAVPVYAGNNDGQCDILKSADYTKGLYGLCNAYWNASEKGKEKVLENYRNKMNEGDPDMPGLEPEEASCPCLDALAALNDYDWGMTVGCTSSGGIDSSISVNPFGIPELPNLTTFFDTGTDGVAFVCSIFQSPDTNIDLSTSESEYNLCLTELVSRCP